MHTLCSYVHLGDLGNFAIVDHRCHGITRHTNMEKRRFMHHIGGLHEWRRRLSPTASGYGDSVCACSQNCSLVKAERIRVNSACYFDPVLLE